MSVFTLPRLERVISGCGTLDALAEELARHDCRRVVIVTGETLAGSPLVARIRSLVGARLAKVFGGARQHVPSDTVAALDVVTRDVGADALVSVGGGSPIDTAKAVVHARLHDASAAVPIHVAVPTTLSAGEFTDVAGVTDTATRIKHALRDPRLAPRTVIADADATRLTPTWLWAASGLRALDHAIETLYARRRHALSDALAERAIGLLTEHLPPSTTADDDTRLVHREACQMAAWLAVFGVTNAGFGLSHALGHQIGPRWNVAHGFTSAIVLPHAMRFMAADVPDRFEPVARALGIAFDPGCAGRAAHTCADRVAELVCQLGLPRRLRDVDVPADELREVAAVVAGLMERSAVVDRVVTADELAGILQAAY